MIFQSVYLVFLSIASHHHSSSICRLLATSLLYFLLIFQCEYDAAFISTTFSYLLSTIPTILAASSSLLCWLTASRVLITQFSMISTINCYLLNRMNQFHWPTASTYSNIPSLHQFNFEFFTMFPLCHATAIYTREISSTLNANFSAPLLNPASLKLPTCAWRS